MNALKYGRFNFHTFQASFFWHFHLNDGEHYPCLLLFSFLIAQSVPSSSLPSADIYQSTEAHWLAYRFSLAQPSNEQNFCSCSIKISCEFKQVRCSKRESSSDFHESAMIIMRLTTNSASSPQLYLLAKILSVTGFKVFTCPGGSCVNTRSNFQWSWSNGRS